MKRVGIIAKKLGMTSLFQDNGDAVPITLFELSNNQVLEIVDIKSETEVNVKVGAIDIKTSKLNNQQKGYFAKIKLEPKKVMKEFRVSKNSTLPQVGDAISANHFQLNSKVDVTGITKGKGFTGVMKRWNFAGLEASHGVSISHRSHGSTGQRQDPGRVFKNKKMAGHDGCDQITVENLKVVLIDAEKNLLGVKGSVPGSENSFVVIKDVAKRTKKQVQLKK
jgi:large subunit ribosomal protein L3